LKISELLDDSLIIDELEGVTKSEVLQEFSKLLYDKNVVNDKDALARILFARESLGSTGIGDGVAIPHGKLKGLAGLVLAFGRSRKGVEFDSLDGGKAHLFFLLIASEDAPGEHLKALARISRMLKNSEVRDSLLKATDKKEIRTIIAKREEDGR